MWADLVWGCLLLYFLSNGIHVCKQTKQVRINKINQDRKDPEKITPGYGSAWSNAHSTLELPPDIKYFVQK